MSDENDPGNSRDTGARYLADLPTPTHRDANEETDSAGQTTMAARAHCVELSIQQAIRRGDFENLPGAGRPLATPHPTHDPDWWIRQKIEREQITGLGPPALTLRSENAALDERLDTIAAEREVRGILDDFNIRVIEARRQLQGGPPVVTPTREVESEVAKWRDRRTARLADQEALRQGALMNARHPTRRDRRRANRKLRRG